MATYKGIQGFTIQNLSADPSNPIEGQVWYNSTSNVWKVEEATTAGAWASGGNMNTARYSLGGAGTQTAALAFGGETFPPTIYETATEEYDGSAWTNPTGLNTARTLAGCGTQTAALAFGGNPGTGLTGATEEYDGSSWANNPTGLNTGRKGLAGAGTQTAALAFGGFDTAVTGATEEYDGSTWTASPPGLNTARRYLGGCGTQTAALGFGGGPPETGATEEYDGTSWTSNPKV
jgi:hypothetical protein